MEDIPARDLRNDISAVLRRVEGGARLRVTVSGRAVAVLEPLRRAPESIPWDEFIRDSDRWQADPGLAITLRELLPEMTDDEHDGR